jgi:hypothetical protein
VEFLRRRQEPGGLPGREAMIAALVVLAFFAAVIGAGFSSRATSIALWLAFATVCVAGAVALEVLR